MTESVAISGRDELMPSLWLHQSLLFYKKEEKRRGKGMWGTWLCVYVQHIKGENGACLCPSGPVTHLQAGVHFLFVPSKPLACFLGENPCAFITKSIDFS